MQMLLNLKAMSYNNFLSNTKTGRRYITKKGKEYLEKLNGEFNNYDKNLRMFGSMIEENKHLVDIEIFYFQKNFYTKKKTISKTVGDVDNPNKVLIDELFKRIGWDDYILGKLYCEKLPSPSGEDKVVVRLSKYVVPECPRDLAEQLFNDLVRLEKPTII